MNGLVDEFQRGHTNRTSRAVNEGDGGGENLVDPEFDDGVRLPPANLHQRPRPGGDSMEFGGKLADSGGIAIFIKVFHGWRLR